MLARLITALFALCQLRLGPQDLPHRPPLVVVLLIAVLALEAFKAGLVDRAAGSVPTLVVSGIYFLAASYLALYLRRRPARYWQTALALIGTGLIFSLLALPLLVLVGPVDTANQAPWLPVVGWAVLLLFGWQLLVAGHIWRHALDVPLPTGVLVALALFVAELLIQRALFGLSDAAT